MFFYFVGFLYFSFPFFLMHFIATIASILSYGKKICWPGYVVCYFGFFSLPVGIIASTLFWITSDPTYVLIHFLPYLGIASGFIIFWLWLDTKQYFAFKSKIDSRQLD